MSNNHDKAKTGALCLDDTEQMVSENYYVYTEQSSL